MKSVYDGVKVVEAVRPTTRTGTGTPVAAAITVVDTFGFNSALFDVAVGSPTGTAVTYVVTIQIQECATSTGTFTNITGATGTITGTTTSASLRAQVRVEGLGTSRLRYLRVVPLITLTPNDGSVVYLEATALLGNAFKKPVSNSATA